MIETNCYRELTKNPKMKGLSLISWSILGFTGVLSWFLLVLWAIPIVAVLFCVLWTLEFFDEDIYKVISLNTKIKSKKYYA
ncbi:hypothetical protein [Campylobacter sp. MIT 97-5078]|uniref:hypothetical protein n=1 Tax=Campylobacter sp. MIT 97-5078 TaxID=1548153 RepID=UPI000513F041|nr:hypothetical protein [Campylobacter sp. MIT 97-5078]KGI55161.1 hypothetical protein LR59_13160 [Campylobacter sp. MIT 97-5078]KGI56799.1 hypothetical protein LR59_04760 [Campylobacter sp. MIT 97-5078]TQR27269.1 hypothetical protein DMB91_04530 [Campylobacter sp. MIT 97-5078]